MERPPRGRFPHGTFVDACDERGSAPPHYHYRRLDCRFTCHHTVPTLPRAACLFPAAYTPATYMVADAFTYTVPAYLPPFLDLGTGRMGPLIFLRRVLLSLNR